MKKLIIKLLIIFSLIISPLITILTIGKSLDKVYSDSYYGELVNKIDYLKSIDDKKIIFIGGSSLAFGLRSDEIEKATSYKAVNFGLYGGLGSLIMLDLAKDYINENDIVIFAPELDSQTYSSYYNYNMIHKCFESNYKYIKCLSYKQKLNIFYNYFDYLIEKQKIDTIEVTKPYSKDSFNNYCDIDVDFDLNNQFTKYYDQSQLINPSVSLIDDDFIDYVNEYNKYVNKKKARMYFTFSPSNELAIIKDNIEEFESLLDSKLDCKILGSVNDFIYNPLYFYDTNYHLNKNGSYIHSKKLSKLINDENNYNSNYTIPNYDVLEPKYSITVTTNYDDFIFDSYQDGLYLKSINNSVKNMIFKLEIPSVINGVNVVGIEDGAFNSLINCTQISLPSTIKSIEGTPFTSCPNLSKIYLNCDTIPTVSPNGLFDGTSNNLKVYIPKSKFKEYTLGYSWIAYKSLLVAY